MPRVHLDAEVPFAAQALFEAHRVERNFVWRKRRIWVLWPRAGNSALLQGENRNPIPVQGDGLDPSWLL